MNYRFGSIPVHVHRQKSMKDTSKDISSGKPTENPKGNAEAIETERAGPSREVDLLPIEK